MSDADDRIALRLQSRRETALGIAVFEFVSADARPLPRFEAGSHVDLHLPGGVMRPYSLSNHPAETHRYEFGVLREPQSRGGSRALHERVAVGDVIHAHPPRQLFGLRAGARRSVLLAGGIGVTPLLAMAEALAGRSSGFTLHYTTRARERCAFLDRLAAPHLAPHVALYHDDADDGARFDAATALGAPEPGVQAYVCGPGGFIDHVLAVAARLDWPADQVHVESFSARDSAPPGRANRPFQLVIASTGRVLDVPAERSAVAVLADHGLAPPVSCEQGICGTCVTTVLAGEPEHRDSYLTADDRARGDCFTPCCSRASGRLVLDL
ncbi:MAG TPA: PDR/VanB family oxidoreductase [Burkholderiaceae bacterium]